MQTPFTWQFSRSLSVDVLFAIIFPQIATRKSAQKILVIANFAEEL